MALRLRRGSVFRRVMQRTHTHVVAFRLFFLPAHWKLLQYARRFVGNAACPAATLRHFKRSVRWWIQKEREKINRPHGQIILNKTVQSFGFEKTNQHLDAVSGTTWLPTFSVSLYLFILT